MKNGDKIKCYVEVYLHFVRRATPGQIAAFLNEGPFALNDGVTPKYINDLLGNSTLFEKRRLHNTWMFVLNR